MLGPIKFAWDGGVLLNAGLPRLVLSPSLGRRCRGEPSSWAVGPAKQCASCTVGSHSGLQDKALGVQSSATRDAVLCQSEPGRDALARKLEVTRGRDSMDSVSSPTPFLSYSVCIPRPLWPARRCAPSSFGSQVDVLAGQVNATRYSVLNHSRRCVVLLFGQSEVTRGCKAMRYDKLFRLWCDLWRATDFIGGSRRPITVLI